MLAARQMAGGISSSQLAASPRKLTPNQESENLCTPTQPYNIYAVISVASGGLLWLFLFRVLNRPELLYLFTLTFAAQLALLLMVARKNGGRPASSRLVLESIVIGWLLLFIPFVLIEGVAGRTIKIAFMALFGVGLAATVFYHVQPVLNYYPTDRLRWLRQASCAVLGSLVGMVSLYFLY
jgi:phytol kinase